MFHSCSLADCEKIPLKKSYLEWYNDLPNEGDILLYKGSNNYIDSFLIIGKEHSDGYCNRFEVSKYQHETFSFTGKMINFKNRRLLSKRFELRFEADEELKKTYQYINLFDVYDEGYNHIDAYELQYMDSVTMNDPYIIVDPRTTEADRYDNSSNRTSIHDFYWSKKRGLVRYTTEKGNTYEFWKRIRHK